MAEFLVLQFDPAADSAARWIVADSDGSRLGPPVVGPLDAARIDLRDRRLIVLVPATEVLSTVVDMPVKSPTRIQQALPFALEEYVAEDVEDLHFAAGSRTDAGRVPVSAVSKDKLERWIAALQDAGLRPWSMIPENYGLAVIPGTISMLLSGDLVYINDGDEVSLVLQGVGPGEALQAIGAMDEFDDAADDAAPPRHVQVYCDAENEQAWSRDFEALRLEFETFDVKLLPDGSLPRLAVTVARGNGVNLLQGQYGPKAEYGNYFRPWRYAAALLLALMVTAVAGQAINTVRLKRAEADLRERFLAEYQEIAPGTEDVRDPEAVIASLRARTGSAEPAASVFLQSLEHLGEAIRQNGDADIKAISYRAGVVDVRISAPSVAVLDSIQRRIDESGDFEADIQSTDQGDDAVDSRIQIRSAGS